MQCLPALPLPPVNNNLIFVLEYLCTYLSKLHVGAKRKIKQCSRIIYARLHRLKSKVANQLFVAPFAIIDCAILSTADTINRLIKLHTIVRLYDYRHIR